MSDQETHPDKTDDKPQYDFIKRTEDPAVFHCNHREVKGMFTMQKQTLGRQAHKERIHGEYAGGLPTIKGDMLAERISTIYVGFAKTPDDFVIDSIEDPKLVTALYDEVSRYWGSF